MSRVTPASSHGPEEKYVATTAVHSRRRDHRQTPLAAKTAWNQCGSTLRCTVVRAVVVLMVAVVGGSVYQVTVISYSYWEIERGGDRASMYRDTLYLVVIVIFSGRSSAVWYLVACRVERRGERGVVPTDRPKGYKHDDLLYTKADPGFL